MSRNWMKLLLGTSARSCRDAVAPPPRANLCVERLEDRTVPASIFATGAAVGAAGTVGVFDRDTQQQVTVLSPYGADFTGGVNVAMGDVTGDGIADIITATSTGGSHVKVFDGNTFAEVRSFLAFDAGFAGGVNVAAGDLNRDGFADIAVAVASGGPPHVEVFGGTDGALLRSFLVYDPGFTGGVRVAIGDVNGDGQADIVTGSGFGTDGNVRAFDGATEALLRSFLVFTGGFNGSLNVAVGDLDGDGAGEILVGAGPSAGPHVKAFDGRTSAETASFFAFDRTFAGGVFVSVTAGANGNEVVVAATDTSHVKTFDGTNYTERSSTLIITGTVSGGLAQVPANEAPAIMSDGGGATAAVSVAENTTAVTTVTATDPDAGATLTYSISGGADAALFAIDPTTGALAFVATPDFESLGDADADGVYDVTVLVSDGTLTASQAIAVTVTDANESPVITSAPTANVPENTTAVTTVTATDADAGDVLAFSITAGGADGSFFTIDPATGALSFTAAPDFETPLDADGDNVYEVEVAVTDSDGNADVQLISVTVTGANEAPAITSDGGGATATINLLSGATAVTTVAATDPDAGTTLTYSISGADANLFTIDPSTGALAFNSPSSMGTYFVTVQVADDGAGMLTASQDLTVTVS